MNTDKIAYFINHPETISAADVTTIKEVKIKFPYCSTLHMLYIKALAVSNSIHFEEELKKSAIHVNDREKLHDLINLTTSTQPIEISVEQKITTPELITKEIEEVEILKPLEIVTKEIETPVEPLPVKTIPIVKAVEKENIKEEKIPVIKKTIEPIVKKEPIQTTTEKRTDKVDMAKIIEDIRLRAEAARNKTKVLEPITPTPIKEEVTEFVPTPEVVVEENIIEKIIETTPEINEEKVIEEIKEEPISIETLNTPTLEEKEIITDDTTASKPLDLDVMAHAMEIAFELDVDNIIKNQVEEKDVTEENITTEVQETEVLDPNSLSFTDWLKYKQGKLKLKENVLESEKVKLTKTEINDLLNKFIEEEPKMSRPQKEFYNPVKNAKKSLDDTTVLVSETLAKIYWMQKNYEKAIKAYEQLSLRNPEKKTFFANQIKKIKQEVKQ